MPKIKTRRAAAKRFELTGSGKYRRRRQNMRHILTKKAPGRKMRLGQATLVDQANEKAVRRMLPNGYAFFPGHVLRRSRGCVRTALLPLEREGCRAVRFWAPFAAPGGF